MQTLMSSFAVYCTLLLMGSAPSASFLKVFHSNYLYGESRWIGIRWSLLYVASSIQTTNVHLLECSGLKSYNIKKKKPQTNQPVVKTRYAGGRKVIP